MPSLSNVLAFRQEMFKKSFDLIQKKGADYNRDQQEQGDTLFNLKVCELLGIVPTTEAGILVRLSDKFMRLISLTKDASRNPAVKDESVLDTVADVHNYVDYLALKYLERRGVDTCGGEQAAQEWAPPEALLKARHEQLRLREEQDKAFALNESVNKGWRK